MQERPCDATAPLDQLGSFVAELRESQKFMCAEKCTYTISRQSFLGAAGLQS